MSVDKQQILETITAVARLITLVFKPKDTKIAIRDHTIVLCEPKEKYYVINIAQGIDRYWNGDSREDIFILNHVICNFIEWYIIPFKKTDPDIHRGMINMAKYLCVSLKYLQKTYKSGNVVGTLQYYIIVLIAVIEDNFYPEMLYNTSVTHRKSFLDDNNDDVDTLIYSTIFDVDKFKNFWTKEELRSICNQFDNCFKMHDEHEYIVFREDSIYDEIELKDAKENISRKNSIDKELKELKELKGSKEKSTSEHEHEYDNEHEEEYKNLNFDNEEGNACVSLFDIDMLTGPIPNNTPTINNANNDNKLKRETHNVGKRNNHYNIHNAGSYVNRLPVPKSLNNVIVNAHISGITNILNMMDKRFTAMLNQSVKGIN